MSCDGFRQLCGRAPGAALFAILVGVLPLHDAFAAPVNDFFTNATPIVVPNEIVASNVGATAEAGEPYHAFEPPEATVWWKWTVPFTATYTISTSNSVATSGLPLDTVMAIYSGHALSSLTMAAYNDDTQAGEFGAVWSQCVFRAYAGEKLMIAVGSLQSAGTIRLSLGLPGRFMPSWQAVGLTGEVVQSSSFAGRLMLVDFWETTCSACVEELPALIRLQQQFGPRGFTIVGLSGDPNAGMVQDYVSGRGVNYPIAMSTPAIQFSLAGGLVGYPTKYFVDPENRMVGSFFGGGSEKIYRSILEPLLRVDPRLRASIRRGNGTVSIRWTMAEPGYSVEAASAPSGGLWTDLGQTPIVTNGEYVVTVPASEAARYFRLKKP